MQAQDRSAPLHTNRLGTWAGAAYVPFAPLALSAPSLPFLRRAQMPPVNVAVIGSGFMGAAHVDALRRVPGVNVVAIASIDFPRAKELAAQFGITNVFDDWKALLGRDDVHAVHNCTPNNLHFEVNKAFIEAGKHVLSEKPLTMTSKESAELVRLARAKGVVT